MRILLWHMKTHVTKSIMTTPNINWL